MLKPAVRRRGREAGRASSWARSRPCVVVGAEPAMRRPAGLLDLRRCCAAARRGVRGIPGVLRRASGTQFLIARRGRGSGRRSTASTTARSRVPRQAARRPSTASRRTSPRRPRAVLLRCSAFFHQVGINLRRRRARRSITSTSSRANSDALASVARLLYALVALGFAYIRCVENADDPRPVLELPVGPQNAPFCSFRCRASERSMCGAWGGCEKARFGEVQFGAAASARRWRRRQCAKYFLCLITPYSGGGRPPTRRLSFSEAI